MTSSTLFSTVQWSHKHISVPYSCGTNICGAHRSPTRMHLCLGAWQKGRSVIYCGQEMYLPPAHMKQMDTNCSQPLLTVDGQIKCHNIICAGQTHISEEVPFVAWPVIVRFPDPIYSFKSAREPYKASQ